MFIKVRLLNGFKKELTYKIPESISKENLLEKIVCVPIRDKELYAIVVKQFDHLPKEDQTFEIREIKHIEKFPEDQNYNKFIDSLCSYYQLDRLHFIKRIKNFLTQKSTEETPELLTAEGLSADKVFDKTVDISRKRLVNLTNEQKIIVDFLEQKVIDGLYEPTLIHGVTGSGKTEIYKKLINTTIKNNKSVLLLLPEVTLAIQFEKIMKEQLPENIKIRSFHSGTSIKDKKITWDLLLRGAPMLIIGVHIPVFLPIANLGFIIIDEEHEPGYQEKKHPKINSKDAAIMRAYENKIPILMGSATPSLNSLHNVKTKGWNFFQLKNRFSGNFPEIKTVFLSDKKFRRNFWISQELENAIRKRLEQKEQVIIFLNRRGYSFFVQCKNCGHISTCPNCSVSLTLHASCKNKNCNKKNNTQNKIENLNEKNETLNCHYCQYFIDMPTQCQECKKAEFIKKGIGTQQVVEILEKIFPLAKIARADMDTSTKKKLWQETMRDFESGKINILVGTQTISKGFHFPKVTLVGVLWADLNLHFPIYNSTETTLQQLIQVAGRAGRNSQESLVIIQAMGQHKIFEYLNEVDYLKFYNHEIEKREMLGYPPYRRLIEVELKNTSEIFIEREANSLAIKLINICNKIKFDADILGPSEPPISKIKNTYIRKIYIKCNNVTVFGKIFRELDLSNLSSQIFMTPNPLS